MKAITYKKYGPPEVLQLATREKPTPKNHEVLIKIHAAEATKGDCELRSFRFPVKWHWPLLRLMFGITRPRNPVLGGYFSGTIEAVGSEVSTLDPGTAVFGCAKLRMGAYGEYLCLPASYTLVEKPTNLSFEEAAAVPLGGLNALHFLSKAQIQPGEKILINGAGGSIGTFAVQIAKMQGAEVTAVDSEIKEAMLRRIGADHFIDYTQTDFTQEGECYDVIFNMVASNSYDKHLTMLTPGGRYLIGNPRMADMLRAGSTTKKTDKIVIIAFAGETREELETLKGLIEAGKIYPVVDKIFTPENAAAAHRYVETEQRLGCVVIAIEKLGRA